jgi:hypothetical protein
MFKYLKLVILFSFFHTCSAQALPKNVQLEYDVVRDGKLFARVKESFTQNGKEYQVQSITKGVGIYALMGERKLTSTGVVTKAGLKPNHFELHQGRNENKTLIADFDWAQNTLTMQKRDEIQTEKLTSGTQDLASYVYQFMFSPPVKDDISVIMTTGKRLEVYQYKVLERNTNLSVAETKYKTLQLSNEAAAGQDKKQLWLAQDHFYLPVRYQLTDDDGKTYEQTLTKIHVE